MTKCAREKKLDIIIELQDYYFKRDLDDGTNYLGVFNALYVSDKILTYDEIAYKFAMSLNTLKRFVDKANTFAEKLFKKSIIDNFNSPFFGR